MILHSPNAQPNFGKGYDFTPHMNEAQLNAAKTISTVGFAQNDDGFYPNNSEAKDYSSLPTGAAVLFFVWLCCKATGRL